MKIKTTWKSKNKAELFTKNYEFPSPGRYRRSLYMFLPLLRSVFKKETDVISSSSLSITGCSGQTWLLTTEMKVHMIAETVDLKTSPYFVKASGIITEKARKLLPLRHVYECFLFPWKIWSIWKYAGKVLIFFFWWGVLPFLCYIIFPTAIRTKSCWKGNQLDWKRTQQAVQSVENSWNPINNLSNYMF